MVPRPEEKARIVILDAKLLKDNSHKAYAKRIGVISVCPSAHNPLFVITLRHGRHTHTHMRTHTHTHNRAHSSYVTGFEEADSSPFSTVPNQTQS